MTVTAIGHSGFAIETGDVTLVFDYYIDPAGAIDDIMSRAQRLYVLVSHSHRDHLNPDIFGWHARYGVTQYIIANECRRKLKRAMDLTAHPITYIHHDEDWSDGRVTVHAFDSTDVGLCYMVTADGRRIFHAGDFTCWHFSEECDEQAVRKAKGDFHAILRRIVAHCPHLDVAMFPVVPNIGGDWAYGPREFLRSVSVDHFIAMHTWGRDREAAQFALYQNPDHGTCHLLPPSTPLSI